MVLTEQVCLLSTVDILYWKDLNCHFQFHGVYGTQQMSFVVMIIAWKEWEKLHKNYKYFNLASFVSTFHDRSNETVHTLPRGERVMSWQSHDDPSQAPHHPSTPCHFHFVFLKYW